MTAPNAYSQHGGCECRECNAPDPDECEAKGCELPPEDDDSLCHAHRLELDTNGPDDGMFHPRES